MWIVSLIFPYAVAIIIFISVAKSFLINEAFNLPIFNYLDASDLTVNVVHDLYGLSWYVLFSLIIYFSHQLIKYIPDFLTIYFFSFGSLLIGIFLWQVRKNRITSICAHRVACIQLYASLCPLAYCAITWFPGIDKQVLLLSLVFIFCWGFCKSLAKYTIYELKVKLISVGTTISFNDTKDVLVSTNHRYYIGNTTKYAFVYNVASNSTTAYPMSSIIAIENTKVAVQQSSQ